MSLYNQKPNDQKVRDALTNSSEHFMEVDWSSEVLRRAPDQQIQKVKREIDLDLGDGLGNIREDFYGL